jgi:cystathionine beta-synthase
MDYSVVDEMIQVNDRESFTVARRLVREEGLFCGGSSGSNVHAALQVARKLGAGRTVVTVLPDSGTRYITKFLSDAWMKDYGFLTADGTGAGERDLGLVEDILRAHPQRVITAGAADTVADVIELFKKHGVSQVPLSGDGGMPGSIVHEVDVLRGLQTGKVTPASPAREVAHAIGGLIYPKARIEELFRIFETDQVGVVVDQNRIVGIVSKIDVLDYMSRRGR